MVFVKIGNYGCGMMSDERFSLSNSINHNPISNWVMIVHDDAEHKHMNAEEIVDLLNSLSEENEQLKIANAKWLDKSLQDRQIRYSNTNHKELTKKYLLLKEENEQLKSLLKEAEEGISRLKESNRLLQESLLESETSE